MHCLSDKEGTQKLIITEKEGQSQSLLLVLFCSAGIGLVAVIMLMQEAVSLITALAIIFLSLAGAGLYLSHRTMLEFDSAQRSIMKTWRIASFSVTRTYRLHDFQSVQIRGKDIPFEGLTLPLYVLYLAGTLRAVKLFETGDQAEAEKIRENIAALMIR